MNINFKITKWILILFLGAISSISAFDIDPVGKNIKEGVERYKSQDFQGSLESFNEAENKAADDERLQYNKGTSYYKLNDFKLALKYFEKSALSNDKNLKLRSLYNKGNAYAKLGDKKNAIKSYMEAINTDPEFLPARKNLEMLTQKQDKEKQNQDQNQEENSNQEEKKDKNQDKNKSTANHKDKKQDKQNEQDQPAEKQNESNKQLTKEEAERILESAKQNKINRKKLSQRQPERNEVFW